MWKPGQNWEHESLAISLARQRPTYNGVYGSTTKFLYRISIFKIHLQMNDHIKLITKIRLFREFLEIVIVPSVFFFGYKEEKRIEDHDKMLPYKSLYTLEVQGSCYGKERCLGVQCELKDTTLSLVLESSIQIQMS